MSDGGGYRAVSRPYAKRFGYKYRRHVFDKLRALDLVLAEFQQLLGHGEVIAEAEVPDDLVSHHAARAGLDPERHAAVRRLTTGGAAVEVMIASAGAGKTTTLGAAAEAWTAAGYDVLGLAPSARAAAELAAATGAPADTVAKWLHEQPRLPQLPLEEAARWRVGPHTVLLVDEAPPHHRAHRGRRTGPDHRARCPPSTTPSAPCRPPPPGSAPSRPPTPCSTEPASRPRRPPLPGNPTPRRRGSHPRATEDRGSPRMTGRDAGPAAPTPRRHNPADPLGCRRATGWTTCAHA